MGPSFLRLLLFVNYFRESIDILTKEVYLNH